MSVAVITEESLAALKALREFAEANPVSLALIRKLAADPNGKPLVESEPRYAIEIPARIRICFTIEDHPGGRCRHVSISNGKTNSIPMPLALHLAPHLGFNVPGDVSQVDALKGFSGCLD